MAKKPKTESDKDLFRQSVGNVNPVKSDKPFLKSEKKPSPIPKSNELDFETRFDKSVDFDDEILSPSDTLSFISPGLQKNVLKKMRKGFYGIDAELDLHGLVSQQAKTRLLKFLHSCIEEGCRCVHIIHGKGYRSPDNVPVLKNNLNKWLRQHQDVLAFCSSPPKDGGAGALYVLLRLSDKYGEEDDA